MIIFLKTLFISNQLRTQKERLESKELHMSLLRQKIAQLEGEKQVRSALAVERDEASLTLRKLQKKVERLQKELSVCREANTELKAKLADTSELKASAQLPSLIAFCKLLLVYVKEQQSYNNQKRKRDKIFL